MLIDTLGLDGILIIAELSANHNNNLDLALENVEAIAKTGANAIKVQTYTADSLSLDVDNEYFGPKKEGPWKGIKPYDLYQEASLPYEWHRPIQQAAEALGLIFFSSPFDKKGVDFLETLNVPLYKVASPEITDIPLIKYMAEKSKPMIISTGMADKEDIALAVDACREVGNNEVTLLKCTAEYPAEISQANLETLKDLRDSFDTTVGVSDHTFGSLVPTLSVAYGSVVIEKHFTLSRDNGGHDSFFSMEPHEFSDMVKAVRNAERALGSRNYVLSEKDKLRRRSLFAIEDIAEGEKVSEENIASLRPGHGLHPKHWTQVIGMTATTNIPKGTPLTFDDLN